MANEFGVKYFEASAKQYINIDEMFTSIVTDVKNRVIAEGGQSSGSSSSKENRDTIKLSAPTTENNQTKTNKGGCC